MPYISIKTELLNNKYVSIINKINKKIAKIQTYMFKNMNDYLKLTKKKGMIIEEYIHIGNIA